MSVNSAQPTGSAREIAIARITRQAGEAAVQTPGTPPGDRALFGAGYGNTRDDIESMSIKQKNALLREVVQTLMGGGGHPALHLSQNDVALLVQIALSNINPIGTPEDVMALINRTYREGIGISEDIRTAKILLAQRVYVASQHQSRWFKPRTVTRTVTRMLYVLFVSQKLAPEQGATIKGPDDKESFAVWVAKRAQIPDQSGKKRASLTQSMSKLYSKYVMGVAEVTRGGEPRFCLKAGTTRTGSLMSPALRRAVDPAIAAAAAAERAQIEALSERVTAAEARATAAAVEAAIAAATAAQQAQIRTLSERVTAAERTRASSVGRGGGMFAGAECLAVGLEVPFAADAIAFGREFAGAIGKIGKAIDTYKDRPNAAERERIAEQLSLHIKATDDVATPTVWNNRIARNYFVTRLVCGLLEGAQADAFSKVEAANPDLARSYAVNMILSHYIKAHKEINRPLPSPISVQEVLIFLREWGVVPKGGKLSAAMLLQLQLGVDAKNREVSGKSQKEFKDRLKDAKREISAILRDPACRTLITGAGYITGGAVGAAWGVGMAAATGGATTAGAVTSGFVAVRRISKGVGLLAQGAEFAVVDLTNIRVAELVVQEINAGRRARGQSPPPRPVSPPPAAAAAAAAAAAGGRTSVAGAGRQRAMSVPRRLSQAPAAWPPMYVAAAAASRPVSPAAATQTQTFLIGKSDGGKYTVECTLDNGCYKGFFVQANTKTVIPVQIRCINSRFVVVSPPQYEDRSCHITH